MPKIVEDEYCKNVIVSLPKYLYDYLTDLCKANNISRNRYIRNWIQFDYEIDKEVNKKGE